MPTNVCIGLKIFHTDGEHDSVAHTGELPWNFDISKVTLNNTVIPKAFNLYIYETNTDSGEPTTTIYDETYTVIVNDGKDGADGKNGTGITIKGSYLSEESFVAAIGEGTFESIEVGDAYIVAQK